MSLDKVLKLERNNLQAFCRTCLERLESNTTTAPTYSIHETPNLIKMIILCTALNINADADEAYPQFLCLKCYIMIQEFLQFREMALQSNEILNKLVENENDALAAEGDAAIQQKMNTVVIKSEDTSEEYIAEEEEATEEFLEIFKAEEPEITSSFTFSDGSEKVDPYFLSNMNSNNIETGSGVHTELYKDQSLCKTVKCKLKSPTNDLEIKKRKTKNFSMTKKVTNGTRTSQGKNCVPKVKKVAKTGAQRSREYRARILALEKELATGTYTNEDMSPYQKKFDDNQIHKNKNLNALQYETFSRKNTQEQQNLPLLSKAKSTNTVQLQTSTANVTEHTRIH